MRARSANNLVLILVAVLASALASSCSRELPTAIAPGAVHKPGLGTIQRFDGSDISGQVVVTLLPGFAPADVAATYGAQVLHWDADERVASLAPGEEDNAATLTAKLATDPRVASSESNGYLRPAESSQKSFAFDDGFGSSATFHAQPAAQALHLNEAHAVATGAGVRIALLDTGIDSGHPDLSGHVAAAYDFVNEQEGAADVAAGVDSNNDGVPDGAWGHGTHVAGIVALTAPGAQLLIGRVLDSDGVGDIVTVAAGIRWAIAQGADVISLSLGALQSSSAITAALEDAEHHGVIVIASAGNWGAEYPHEFPARDEHANAIAASDAWGVPAPWTSFASYVKVSAPGIAIRSTYPGGRYMMWSGTSMSVPFVSGTAALLRQLHPSWSEGRIVRWIQGTTQPMSGLTAAQFGKLGTGMLDVGAAVGATPVGGFEPDPLPTPTMQ